jgi:hypothetical protein
MNNVRNIFKPINRYFSQKLNNSELNKSQTLLFQIYRYNPENNNSKPTTQTYTINIKNTIVEKMEKLREMDKSTLDYTNLYNDIISVGEFKIHK